jgi:hypothetical protein
MKMKNRATPSDFFKGEFSSIFDKGKYKNWVKIPVIICLK